MRRCRQTPPVIPADLVALSQPKFNGAWVFTDSENRKPFVTQKNIFLPRIGAAIRVNDKTAVNIGFARYVVPLVDRQGNTSANTLAACQWCPGFNQTSTPLPFVEGRPQAYLSNPFPSQLESSAAADRQELLAHTPMSATPPTGPIRDYQHADQRSHQLHDHARDSRPVQSGRHLVHEHRPERSAQPEHRTWPIRTSSYTLKAQLSQNIPNPFFNYLTPDVFPGNLRNPTTVTRGSLLRPYPHYGESDG